MAPSDKSLLDQANGDNKEESIKQRKRELYRDEGEMNRLKMKSLSVLQQHEDREQMDDRNRGSQRKNFRERK